MPQFLQGLKEQSQFLGNKLEKLLTAIQGIKQDTKISVDMSETSQKVDALKVDLAGRLESLKEAVETGQIDTRQVIATLVPVLESVKNAVEAKELLVQIPDNADQFESLLMELKKTAELIKKIPQPKEDKEVHKLLKGIEKAVSGIKLEEKESDFTPLEQKLTQLIAEMKAKTNKELEALTKEVRDAVKALKIKIPDTIKLDDMQFRELATRGTSFGGVTNSGEYYTNIQDNNQTVTTAGTRVQLNTTAIRCSKVTITARISNAGEVVVGGSTVVAAVATRRGTTLFQGDSVTLYVNDLSKIYVDAVTSGDRVEYTYFD